MTTMVLLIAPMALALLLVHRRDGHRARHRAGSCPQGHGSHGRRQTRMPRALS
ncbi:hypothetical protein ACXNSR_01545 [Streptomyces sp. NC-S4]